MFGRESKAQARVDILIGATARIKGDIDFSGGLYVEGRVRGDVRAYGDEPSTVSLGANGSIEGNIEATQVVLNGTVCGDVRAADRVVLGATARITGTVYYKVIESAAGAEINGMLVQHDVVRALALDPPLPALPQAASA